MKPEVSWRALVASCLVAGSASAPAMAQVSLSLRGGFTPDPMELSVSAGGEVEAASAVRGCSGWIADQPALIVNHSEPGLPLSFGIVSGDDQPALAGIVASGPDGIFRCAAADGSGQAFVRFDPSVAGEHAIWPSFAEAGGPALVRVFITELDAPAIPGDIGMLRAGADPAGGRHAVPETGRVEVGLTLAASVDVSGISADCRGYIEPSRPDAVFSLDAGRDRLQLRARSNEDTTMVVLGPDGTLSCNDDAFGLDPAVTLSPAGAGDYAVWVGTYGSGVQARATLQAEGADGELRLRTEAEPAGGVHPLVEGEALDLPLALRPTSRAEDYASGCYGMIDAERPDAVVRLDGDRGRLELRARSSEDTTLVVVSPDGTVSCNDDTHGLDPEVRLMPAPAGDYAVWIGTYGEVGMASARLRASAGAAPLQAAPGATHVFAGGELELALDIVPDASATDFGPDCWGEIRGEGPDAVIRIESDRDVLGLHASGSSDTTLVVLGPDGAVQCDDDSIGLDPVVTLRSVPAGDYAVWVGTYGGEPDTVRLRISDAAPTLDDFGGGESPFLGRPLRSAEEALGILINETGLGEVLTYGRLEPVGLEGFVLHDVVIADLTGESPPLRAGRLRVGDLDLDGMTETGAPGRFSVALEEIDYAALAEAVAEDGMIPPLPLIEGNPPFSLALSLLPPAGETARRVMSGEMRLDGQFALALEARMHWHDGVGIPDDIEDLPTEALAAELRNFGFLGAAVRAQAKDADMEPAEFTDLILRGIRAMVAPIPPDSPKAQFIGALTEALADPDRPGLLRLRMSTDAPQGLEELLAGLEDGDILADERIDIDIAFEPLP